MKNSCQQQQLCILSQLILEETRGRLHAEYNTREFRRVPELRIEVGSRERHPLEVRP